MSSKLPSRVKSDRPKPYDRNKAPRKKGIVEKVASYLPSWLGIPSWLSSINDPTTEEGEDDELVNSVAGPSNVIESPSSEQSYTRGPIQRSERTTPPTNTNTVPQINGDDQSDNSETSASTSGCSSLAPSHQERKKGPLHPVLRALPLNDSALQQIRADLTVNRTAILGEVAMATTSKTTPKMTKHQFQAKKTTELEDEDEGEEETAPSTQTSLWSEDEYVNSIFSGNKKRMARPQQTGTSKKPKFSLSSYGAPITGKSAWLRTSPNSTLPSTFSPFYNGNTTFGGASAYRKSRLNASLSSTNQNTSTISAAPYQSFSQRNANKECLSSAAKRILNSLQKMPTPISDAKKIPTNNHSAMEFALSYTPARYRPKQARMTEKLPTAVCRKAGPPSVGIITPNYATIGRTFEPLVHIDRRVPQTTNQEIPDQVDSFADKRGSGGKMKSSSKSGVQHYKRNDIEVDDDNILEEIDLPQISLPITSLPTFSFNRTNSSSTPKPSFSFSAVSSATDTPTTNFSFASPIQKRIPSPSNNESAVSKATGQPTFNFSVPNEVKESVENEKAAQEATLGFCVPSPREIIEQLTTMKSATPPMGLKRKQSQVDVAPPTSTPKLIQGGSVLDFLGIPRTDTPPKEQQPIRVEKNNLGETTKTTGFGMQAALGSWTCGSCLVVNKSNDARCICCETSKPVSVATPSTVTVETPKTDSRGFGDIFKPVTGSWQCSACLVNNKKECEKCACCDAPRVVAVATIATKTKDIVSLPATGTVTSSGGGANDGFASFFKKSAVATATLWTCDTCLVNNQQTQNKCVACETPKPNLKPDINKTVTFNFPKLNNTNKTNTAVDFKFGLPAAATVTMATTLPVNSTTIPSTSIPVTVSNPTNIFGSAATVTVATTSSTPFVFGNKPIAIATNQSNDFKFGVPSAMTTPSFKDTPTFKADPPTFKEATPTFKEATPTFKVDTSTFKVDTPTFKVDTPALTKEPIKTVEPFSFAPIASGTSGFTFGTPKTNIATVVLSTAIATAPVVTSTTSSGFKFAFSDQTKLSDRNVFGKASLPGATVVTPNPINKEVTLTVTSTNTMTTPGSPFFFKENDAPAKPFVSSSPFPAPPASSAPFMFGSTTPAVAPPPSYTSALKSPFAFGSTSTSSAPLITPTSVVTTPSTPFVFGAKTTPQVATSSTGSFSFGFSGANVGSTAPPTVPVFGSSMATPPTRGGAFSFGSSAPVATIAQPVPALGGGVFRFGTTAASATSMGGFQSATPSFQFGANQSLAPPPSLAAPQQQGIFRFGAAAQEPASVGVPQSGGIVPQSNLGFSGFSAVPQPNPLTTPANQFQYAPLGGVPAANVDNPFNVAGSNANTGHRKIRRAVRRVIKK